VGQVLQPQPIAEKTFGKSRTVRMQIADAIMSGDMFLLLELLPEGSTASVAA